jgi:hypothetical protein
MMDALAGERQDRIVQFITEQIAFILQLSAQVSSCGLIVAEPMMLRTDRIDFRTVSGNIIKPSARRPIRSLTLSLTSECVSGGPSYASLTSGRGTFRA